MGAIRQLRVLSCGVFAALLMFPLFLFADELVVTSTQTPPLSLTPSQIRDVFLGRTTSFPDGSLAIPVDQPESSPLREEFYLKLTNRSAAQAAAHWAKLYFTGRGVPPRKGASSADVKKILNSTPGAIGYVERAALDDSLRVLYVVP